MYNLIVVFIMGLIFGSFYNVVAYRLPNHLSIVKPRSFCPTCQNQLKWYENIPLFSYLIQLGKCRNCKTKISFFYIFIELLTAMLFALSYYLFQFSELFFISLIVSSFLVIVIVSDCRYLIIPDEVTVAAVILMLIVKIIYNPFTKVLEYLLAGLVLFIIMYLIMYAGNKIFKKESLGGGDIKLMFFSGLTVGIPLGVFSIFLASFIALPISLVFYLRSKDNVVPFGPFLLIALLAIVLLQLDINKILAIFI